VLTHHIPTYTYTHHDKVIAVPYYVVGADKITRKSAIAKNTRVS